MNLEKKALLLSGGTFIIIASLYVVAFFSIPYRYVIPNVPYYGIYTYQGDNARFLNDVSTSVTTIFDYWRQSDFKRTDLTKIEVDPSRGGVTLNNLGDFFQTHGYDVSQERLSYNQLQNYINKKQPTPLLIYVPIDPSFDADSQLNILSVVVGVDETNKTIILNDYWYGYNYPLSWSRVAASDSKASVLIARPQDLNSALALIDKNTTNFFSPRTNLMVHGETMIKNYLIGLNHLINKRYDLAQLYFSGVEKDPGFQKLFPPVLKVNLYTAWGSSHLNNGEYGEAKKYAQLAIDNNKNLNEAQGEWKGFEFVRNAHGKEGESSTPYELMGDIFAKQKNTQQAETYYKKAIEIYPNSSLLKSKISNL